jgi:hypothetical protein
VRIPSHAGRVAVNLQAAADSQELETVNALGGAAREQYQAVLVQIWARQHPIVPGRSNAVVVGTRVDGWVFQACLGVVMGRRRGVAKLRDSGCPIEMGEVAWAGAVEIFATKVVGLLHCCWSVIASVVDPRRMQTAGGCGGLH